ncbi:MAG: hypothetical protein JJU19_12010 [Pararhodobacter sp.]|nr:hypothetical protein [Pararhodobacter sp.]
MILGLGLAVSALAQVPGNDDLQALRFYLQQQNTQSTEAELRRLQLAFPDWEPPEQLEDLLLVAPSVEIDEIYRLIGAERYDEARAAIARTRDRFPTWQPPENMLRLLTVSEAQARFDAAFVSPTPEVAADIARQVPELLACDRIDNAWRLADQFLREERPEHARGLHRAVLETCSNADDIVATLEKASEFVSEADLTEFFEVARRRLPDESARLAVLETRLRAGRGFQPGAAAAPATGAPPSRPTASERAATARPAAGAPAGAAGAAAAGPAGGGGALRAAAARADWGTCLSLTANRRDAAALYERGWCALNARRSLEAVAAFQTAAASRLPATQRRDAQYGLALAYLAEGMVEQAAGVAGAASFTRSQRVDVEAQILDQRGVSAFRRGDFARAIAFFNAHEALTGHIRRDLSMLRAYAHLNSGNREAARREFLALDRQFSTRETRSGIDSTQ